MRKIWKICGLMILMSRAMGQTGPGGVGNSSTNKLWLKADAITGVSDGGSITTWYDNSGNNNNFTQSTSGKRPVWDQSNSNFNNKSTVHFDGSNDYLQSAATISDVGNYDIFIVYKTTVTSTQHLLNSGTGTLKLAHEGSTTDKAYHDGTARGTELTGTGTKFVIWNLNSSGSSIYENGTQTQSALSYTQRAISSATSVGANSAGNGSNLNGDIAEIIVYFTNVNIAQRIILENYFAAKYGITIANDAFAYQAVHEDDLAGIGKWDASNQNTAGMSAGILKISNASSMNDYEGALFGHDAGSIASWSATEAPNTNIRRLPREMARG